MKHALVAMNTTGHRVTTDSMTTLLISLVVDNQLTTTWHANLTIPAHCRSVHADPELIPLSWQSVAAHVHGLINDAILVSSRATFHYAMLKNAFKQVSMPYTAELLSIPNNAHHARHGHRTQLTIAAHQEALIALFDALMQIQTANQQPEGTFTGRACLPKALEPQIQKIPNSPGVYLFFDKPNNKPLYIGKSIHLKTRVLSHFQSAHTHNKSFRLVDQIRHIEWQQTAGELGALLLESRLVKSQMPVYNRKLRRRKMVVAIERYVGDDGYTRLHCVRVSEHKYAEHTKHRMLHGTFTTQRQAEHCLRRLIKRHRLCPKFCGLDTSEHACFSFQLKRCNGACVGNETVACYNQRVLAALAQFSCGIWPYAGPILVTERCTITDRCDIHVIDQWQYYATVPSVSDAACTLQTLAPVMMHVDEIQLLRSHVRQHPEQVSQLAV